MGVLLEKLSGATVDQVGDAVDLSVIDALIEDTSLDFFPSLLEVFETESSQRLINIDSALESGDTGTLGVEAHSLKGTSATFGAEQLRSVVYELEKAGKAGDMDQARTLVPQIAPLYERVLAALKLINSEIV